MKRRYKQNLLEAFYIVANSFTLFLDSDLRHVKNYYEKSLRTIRLFIENTFYNVLGKNVLNEQSCWYVFVICKIKVILMPTLC